MIEAEWEYLLLLLWSCISSYETLCINQPYSIRKILFENSISQLINCEQILGYFFFFQFIQSHNIYCLTNCSVWLISTNFQ